MLHARHPFVFAVNNNEYKTFNNMFQQIIEGQPAVFGTEMMSTENLAQKIAAFNTGISP